MHILLRILSPPGTVYNFEKKKKLNAKVIIECGVKPFIEYGVKPFIEYGVKPFIEYGVKPFIEYGVKPFIEYGVKPFIEYGVKPFRLLLEPSYGGQCIKEILQAERY